MKNRKNFFGAISMAAMVALTGCSDDTDNASRLPDQPGGDTEETTASAAFVLATSVQDGDWWFFC